MADAIVYCCSRENPANDEVFRVGAGMVARNAVFGNKGYRDPALTAERLHDHIERVRNLSDVDGSLRRRW